MTTSISASVGGSGGQRGSAQSVKPPAATAKDTVISVIIAFALAFVFRGFVIEAFLIPTGSMAPTLLGAHMRFQSPQTGYNWAVSPQNYRDNNPQTPAAVQTNVSVRDPMSGIALSPKEVRTSWGDRIFVMKYLYSIYDPQRFDVVVFKNPRDPTVNFIKRLVGLPGEQIALVDGDVFTRKPGPGEETSITDQNAAVNWTRPGWTIARKPERVQRAVWLDVFSSAYAARSRTRSPWIAGNADASAWTIEGRQTYLYKAPAGGGATSLAWDATNGVFSLDDSYAYNQLGRDERFPVSDLRMALSIRPEMDGQTVSAVLDARRHEFRATVDNAGVELAMRAKGDQAWTTLERVARPGLIKAGRVTNIELWHADQALWLFVGEQKVAYATYDWTPEQRVKFSTGLDMDAVASEASALCRTSLYDRPNLRWEFTGGSFEVERIEVGRDLHYQARLYGSYNDVGSVHAYSGKPGMATHPDNTPTLSPDQFFVCGDNSPQSLDARLWDLPNPWVAEIDPAIGVVNRELLIGKAFFVYFPAPLRAGNIPIVDFGRMRFIK